MNKLGILQGRLSKPDVGLQDSPLDWQKEFEFLNQLNLNHIEWVVTRKRFHQNPIFSEDVSSFPISSVCCDFLVDGEFLNQSYVDEVLYQTISRANDNGIKTITLPLLEESSLKPRDLGLFLEVYSKIFLEFSDNIFCIESDFDPVFLLSILHRFDNLRVTYDTGNITCSDVDHSTYIDVLGEYIVNVHIKDRDLKTSDSVFIGIGDTDFNLIFDKLSRIGYDGLYTLQVVRGVYGDEFNYILSVIDSVRGFFDEKFI